MLDTYKFIAYLCNRNHIIGMRIEILGDINGNSVFDVSRKLLDKYGVCYNLADKESDRISIEQGVDDGIPELIESLEGFHKWILYKSEKFGISEYFTCNMITNCEMCPLKDVSGYCTCDYGVGLCEYILSLNAVSICRLLNYLKSHTFIVEKYINYISDLDSYINEILDSDEYKNYDINGLNEPIVVFTADQDKEVVNIEKKEVKPSKRVKKRTSKSDKISQLKAEIYELDSKISMLTAFNIRMTLFSSNNDSKQVVALKNKLSSKKRELELLSR